ncbi:hypothetical protein BJ912DRAFT_1049285 [Pholiota molesta]|nr:hypothetical protein BJ912DRAFT_1049285 [Pholiota molesta]
MTVEQGNATKRKHEKKQGNQNKNKTIENSSDVLQPSLHSIIHANTQQNPREGITCSGCRSPIDGGLGPSPATHSRRSQAMSYMRDAKGRSSPDLCMPSLGSRCTGNNGASLDEYEWAGQRRMSVDGELGAKNRARAVGYSSNKHDTADFMTHRKSMPHYTPSFRGHTASPQEGIVPPGYRSGHRQQARDTARYTSAQPSIDGQRNTRNGAHQKLCNAPLGATEQGGMNGQGNRKRSRSRGKESGGTHRRSVLRKRG